MNTASDRISYLIETLCRGNKSLFASKIGVTPSVIGNITGDRRGNPSFEVTQKIACAFAELSAEWLLTGEGEMLKPTTPITPQPATPIAESQPPATVDRLLTIIEGQQRTIECQQRTIEALTNKLE